jgi:hypothetical protein
MALVRLPVGRKRPDDFDFGMLRTFAASATELIWDIHDKTRIGHLSRRSFNVAHARRALTQFFVPAFAQ